MMYDANRTPRFGTKSLVQNTSKTDLSPTSNEPLGTTSNRKLTGKNISLLLQIVFFLAWRDIGVPERFGWHGEIFGPSDDPPEQSVTVHEPLPN